MANMLLDIRSAEAVARDEDDGFLEFRVRGTWRGEAFEYVVACEIDGRDAEWEHVSGADPNEECSEEWLDENVRVYEACHATPEWKAATGE